MCDREKVIKEWEAVLSRDPLNLTWDLVDETLTLLKAQEARILDWDELEDWGNAVWFENKDEQDCYIALMANVGTFDATIVNVEPGKCHRLAYLHEFYKKEWRCWSAEPTAKQRKAAKWG